MTGRIKSLDPASGVGVIAGADGSSVGFSPSAVLAYDLAILAIDQVVSFDLEGGKFLKATNVVVQRPPRARNAKEKHAEISELRYMGFEHKGNVRVYRFERLVPGEARGTFTVDADLALFTKHHVGIQEGPALCLRLLAAELDLADAVGQIAFQCTVTDREMLAHLASRPVPRVKYGPKHTPPAPDTASHVR